ncbi:MAG TPA: tRNA lysidine(34) synthetase TilS [Gammaproteobacteria bacterium]|nr:tRNA lysidine(34) synthetase TilS [Gammaproteobacteria bacterium]
MRLEPTYLGDWLTRHPVPAGSGRVWIAFSGGMDSTVLLHLARALRDAGEVADLRAIHIDHGLHQASAEWARRCRATCRELGIPLSVTRVSVRVLRGESLEAVARQARYGAFGEHLGAGDRLLVAHHSRDQLETFLLQALRGSGPDGLAAMPAVSPLGPGFLMRPLLAVEHAAITDYGRSRELDWIEDPANVSLDYDRNYLRHEILPPLERRWPSAARTVSRSATLCAEVSGLLGALADRDLAERMDGHGRLNTAGLQELDAARLRNLLRQWLRRRRLPMPSQRKLERIRVDALTARYDRTPCIRWAGGEVRRYRRSLYGMTPLPPRPDPGPCHWDGCSPFELPSGLGRLVLVRGEAPGLDPSVMGARLAVGFRRGGERLTLRSRTGSRALKSLLQEVGVVPWMRPRVPLLFVDGELAAVAIGWYASGLAAAPGAPALRLHWEGAPALH